jgi:hypothetical protein
VDTASKVLVVGGLLNLVYAFAVGFVLSRIRLRTPDTGRYLPLAHRVSLWWGFLLLGMPWAVQLSTLPARAETLAAALLVGSSALSAVEPLVNLFRRVEDPVAERSLGFYLAGAAGVLASAGLLPFVVGALIGS